MLTNSPEASGKNNIIYLLYFVQNLAKNIVLPWIENIKITKNKLFNEKGGHLTTLTIS